MKKFFIFMAMLSMIAFTACSNDDNVIETPDNNVTAASDSTLKLVDRNMKLLSIQNSIKLYNFNTFGEETPETRFSLGKFFRKFINIFATVAADALGGVLGGVAGGVASSGIVGGAILFKVSQGAIVPMPTSTRAFEHPIDATPFNRDSIIFNDIVPIGFYPNDSIGYYHNKVLYNMFSDENKVIEFKGMTQKGQALTIVNEMKKEPYLVNHYGKELNNTVNMDKGIDVANAVIEIAKEVDTEDEFFARLSEIGLTDENIIGVMKEIIHGLENTDATTDDGTYYQNVLQIIYDSDLDEETKARLSDGVIIGQASNHLWRRIEVTK